MLARVWDVVKFAAPLALFSLVVVATPALAETEAERSACMPDVWRLCASEIPNVSAIKTCLSREHTRPSAACRTVMQGPDTPVRTVAIRR